MFILFVRCWKFFIFLILSFDFFSGFHAMHWTSCVSSMWCQFIFKVFESLHLFSYESILLTLTAMICCVCFSINTVSRYLFSFWFRIWEMSVPLFLHFYSHLSVVTATPNILTTLHCVFVFTPYAILYTVLHYLFILFVETLNSYFLLYPSLL